MKYMIITSLGSLIAAHTALADPVLNERFEISPSGKMSLSSGGCTDITLEAAHILHANCKGWDGDSFHPDPNKPPKQAKKTQLDLDRCFVNNLGTLNRAYGKGGYSGSCVACLIQDGTTLRCSCGTGLKQPELKTNFVNLDDWRTINVSPFGDLGCPNTNGIE